MIFSIFNIFRKILAKKHSFLCLLTRHTSPLTSLLSQAHLLEITPLCAPLGAVMKSKWLHSFPDVVGGAPAYFLLTTYSSVATTSFCVRDRQAPRITGA